MGMSQSAIENCSMDKYELRTSTCSFGSSHACGKHIGQRYLCAGPEEEGEGVECAGWNALAIYAIFCRYASCFSMFPAVLIGSSCLPPCSYATQYDGVWRIEP